MIPCDTALKKTCRECHRSIVLQIAWKILLVKKRRTRTWKREQRIHSQRSVKKHGMFVEGEKFKVTAYRDEVRMIRSQLLKGLTCYARRYALYLTGTESRSGLFRWKMTWLDFCFEIITSGNCKEKIRDWSQSDSLGRSGNSLAEEVRGTWIHVGEVRMKREWSPERCQSGMIE